jgi:phage-related minor tail protein
MQLPDRTPQPIRDSLQDAQEEETDNEQDKHKNSQNDHSLGLCMCALAAEAKHAHEACRRCWDSVDVSQGTWLEDLAKARANMRNKRRTR